MDSLLESSAERISSAANSFSIMRQQQLQQSNYPTTSTPLKPAVSPKPTPSALAERDRKLNNSSPSYSTVSNDSSISYNYTSQYQQSAPVPPPPPQRSYQSGSQHSTFRPPGSNGTSGQYPPPPPTSQQEEDLYARPRHPDQYYTASSAASTPAPATPKKTFMKPSEFYSEAQRSPSGISTTIQVPTGQQPGFTPPKGGFQVLPTGFGKSFGKVQQEGGSTYQEEYSQYDTGPLRSEQVFETRGADGSISLRRIFTQQQQSSSSSSVVSSSRKVFQQKNEGSSQ